MGDRYLARSPGRRGPIRDRGGPPRDRDDHPNVEYFGAGESYRPGGQTGDGPYRPMRDRENDRWNPSDRRDRDDRRRDEIDSYIPPTSSRAPRIRSRSPPPYRRRSRSPPSSARSRTELFPDRGNRSPPSRRYSPQRSDRARSPPPPRRRSRSPYAARGRSPDNKRPRDFTPDGRPSPKRDRYDSPPRARNNDRPRSPPRRGASPMYDTYRPRSRTPPRPNYAEDRWRRRSPSPRASGATSRRSSPPVHADRISVAGSRPHSPHRRYDDREPYTSRPRSPPRRTDYSDRDRDRSRDRSRDRDDHGAPTAPSGPRGGSYRATPSGPSKSYTTTTSPPPPASGASVSAHNRSGTFAPPSGPRGSAPARDFVSPPGAVRGRTSLTYRAPGYRPPLPNQPGFERPPSPVNVPPSGPRASSFSRGDYGGAGRGAYPSGPSRSSSSSYHVNNDFPFRPNMNNSTSTTYPRSQRFNTGTTASIPVGPSSVSTSFNNGPASAVTASPTTPSTPANFVKSQLNTLERIVPGGKHIPGSAQSTTGLSADQEKRLKSLDEEAERMRSDIIEKQRAKRESLNDWEDRERESTIAALRSDLAESHLRTLGEDDTAMTGTAF